MQSYSKMMYIHVENQSTVSIIPWCFSNQEQQNKIYIIVHSNIDMTQEHLEPVLDIQRKCCHACKKYYRSMYCVNNARSDSCT